MPAKTKENHREHSPVKVKTGRKAPRREPFFSLFLVCTADRLVYVCFFNRPGLVLSLNTLTGRVGGQFAAPSTLDPDRRRVTIYLDTGRTVSWLRVGVRSCLCRQQRCGKYPEQNDELGTQGRTTARDLQHR